MTERSGQLLIIFIGMSLSLLILWVTIIFAPPKSKSLIDQHKNIPEQSDYVFVEGFLIFNEECSKK
jgi:hypothetical protein